MTLLNLSCWGKNNNLFLSSKKDLGNKYNGIINEKIKENKIKQKIFRIFAFVWFWTLYEYNILFI